VKATLALSLVLAEAAGAVEPVVVTSVDPPTDLSGPWRCRVGDDPAWSSPDLDDSAWEVLHLPDGGRDRACVGAVVWLRKVVQIDQRFAALPLGFSPGLVDGAFEVYVDGAAIGGAGDIAKQQAPIHEGHAFAIPAEAARRDMLTIALRIGNEPALFDADPSRRLVPMGPVAIGQLPALEDRARTTIERAITERSLGFLAMSLTFAFISFYHLLLWFLRRDLDGYLWFGINGVLVTTWLGITELRSTVYLPIDGVTAGVVGNFFGTLVNAAFVEFLWRFVRGTRPTRPWRIYQSVLVAVSLLGVVPVYGLPLTVSAPVILTKIAMPFAGTAALISWSRHYRDARLLLVAFVVGVIGAIAQVWVVKQGVTLPVTPAELAFLGVMIVMAIALARQFTRTLADVDQMNRELRETNASIARFVPFGFLDALGRSSVIEVQRGDARARDMAVMFCDVRGFTTMAESLGPEGTFRFINDYLARMEPEIYRGAGFINQYLGDGIMALFPSRDGRSGADGAVIAAVGMCRALEKLNGERRRRGEPAVQIGIGVHGGTLMIGTIGGGEQLDGGVVGDCVNAAARLEGMTKMYGSTLLISGEIVARLQSERPTLRHLDTVLAKGKSEAMAIYEVLDVDPAHAEKAATLERFTEAQRLYRAGDFVAAGAAFERVLATHPGDGAARLLRERCLMLATSTPASWNGVFALVSK
jgi:class 3 adenylate cyclase